jgi:hypothetical protein
MSEPLWIYIEIGGDLPKSGIEELLASTRDELSDGNGPTTEKELRSNSFTGKSYVKWDGPISITARLSTNIAPK